jgi:RHS repeat-associated protein
MIIATYTREDENNWYFEVQVWTDDYVPPPEYHVTVIVIDPVDGDVLGDPYNRYAHYNIGNGQTDNYYRATLSISKQFDHVYPPLRVQGGIWGPGTEEFTSEWLLWLPDPQFTDPDDDEELYTGECSSQREYLTVSSNTRMIFDTDVFGQIEEIVTKGSPKFEELKEPVIWDIREYHSSQFEKNGGYPVLSFGQKSFTVIVKDTPLGYETGIGPDVRVDLVYRGISRELSNIGGTPNTQYYPFGSKWSFSYGSFYQEEYGDRIRIAMPNGTFLFYHYDIETGEYMPPPGIYDKLEKTGSEYQLTFKDSKKIFHFSDPVGKKLTAVEDRNGNRITIHYDTDYNIDYIVDADNRRVEFSLDPVTHFITEIEDPTGRTAQFQYDSNGCLKEVTDMGGYTSSLSYDIVPVWSRLWVRASNERRLTSVLTPFGLTQIQYEVPSTSFESGSIMARITVTNPMNNRQTFEYTRLDVDKAMTSVTDSRGAKTDYLIDSKSRRIEQIDYPDGNSMVYGYDEKGNRNTVSLGTFSVQYTFDDFGNVTSFTNPRNKTSYYTYDANHNLTGITDPMGSVTSLQYDGNSNLTNIIRPLSEHRFAYDEQGRITEYINPNGNAKRFSYDAGGYLTAIEYPSGPPTAIVNDEAGRPVNITQNGLNYYQFQYDNLDNIVSVTFPDGSSAKAGYKLFDMIEYTDFTGRTTVYSYNGMHSLIMQTGPEGIIHFDRDANENARALNINGQRTNYEYDALNRITNMVNPDGSSQEFTYDALGNVQTRVDENGIQATYTYDFDLLTNISYSDGTPSVSFTYNDNGEIISMMDGIGTTSFGYDSEARMIQVDGPFAQDEKTYTYDAVGNRKSMDLPNMHISYVYDELNRIISVTSNYGSADYVWNVNTNLLNRINYGNDTFCEYEFDMVQRVKSVKNKNADGTVISEFNYNYDKGFFITEITDHENNRFQYDYDHSYRVIKEEVTDKNGKWVWHDQYTYDNMGNRIEWIRNGLRNFYQYNIGNQLVRSTETAADLRGIVEGSADIDVYVENIKAETKYLGENRVEFRANHIPVEQEQDSIRIALKVNEVLASAEGDGSFSANEVPAAGSFLHIDLVTDTSTVSRDSMNRFGITRINKVYTYDSNGNLVSRAIGDSSISYAYDAENRLTRMDFSDGTYLQYQYDGMGQLVKVFENGVLKKQYIYDEPFIPVSIISNEGSSYLTYGHDLAGGVGGLINLNQNNQKNYYFYNSTITRGNVVNTADEELNITEYQYDAFGNVKGSEEDNTPMFLHSTKEYDSKSGLLYFGFRFYDPGIGRWITKDPIGFGSEEVNLYTYVGNNPLFWVDTYGLKRYRIKTGKGERVKITFCKQGQWYDPLIRPWERLINRLIDAIYRSSDTPTRPTRTSADLRG